MPYSITEGQKLVLGMIHLSPLPGTPFFTEGSFAATLDTAVRSARALDAGGADGCLVQTVDRVYSVEDSADPARTVAMGLVVNAVRQAVRPDFQIGVQLMRNALKASLAVAKVAGGSFIRANALVGMTLTAHGMVRPDPHDVMAYRRGLDAWDIGVIADIDTMHYSWFGGEKSTGEVARAARGAGADAVSVCHPDDDRTLELIGQVRRSAPGLPVILGGHTNHDNAARLLAAADGAFVGTCLERDGWGGEIDVERVREYVAAVRSVRS
ncbi:BtpA/SgcQ family protein [Micromonospora sp. RTGN7]|uniref:BtpA/SgcQ family protein n=1 Tax=Micromonospora sp. RTGN7 TaxID=3016526 RepID=UPI0029FF0FD2|nr:BtpA/SgcQ family protein [Micromonospora sp. RTGN7]